MALRRSSVAIGRAWPSPPSSYNNFTADLSIDQNPAGSPWINAGSGGMATYWKPMRILNNRLQGAEFIVDGYTDGISYVNPAVHNFGSNHIIISTIYLDPTYSPINTHETQHVLRCNFLGADLIQGVEILLAHGASQPVVAKWYGGGGGGFFADITTSTNPIGFQNGDELISQIETIGGNPTINVWRRRAGVRTFWASGLDNGSSLGGAPKILSGYPGAASFVRADTGQDLTKLCFSSFYASDDPAQLLT